MDGEKFTFRSDFKLNIESVADDCEVLATAADGRPMFVKKSYGKGYIYFTPSCIESRLTDRAHAFCEEAEPFCKLYEKFAAEASADRAAKSNVRLLLLTEHEISDDKRIIIGVNYQNKPASADIELRGGWSEAPLRQRELFTAFRYHSRCERRDRI